MGAPDFKPTLQRPVGWRGDWTGRFPGAMPPTVWGRWALGAGRGMLNQAQKPIRAKKDLPSRPVEFGILREWLILGPFPASDPAKDIDQEFAPNEAQMQPDDGEKVGVLAWKSLHVSMETQSNYSINGGACGEPWVNFDYLFGKTSNQVAYAHTYLLAKTGGKAELSIDYRGDAAKVWLNGNPVKLVAPRPGQHGQQVAVDLIQGWNRLLVKVAYGAPKNTPSPASISVRVLPTAPIAYETRNVAWMTYLPGTTVSQPIVVGDRIFASFGNSDLICMDKANGKILWMRSNYQYDAMTEAERADYPGLKDRVDPLLAKMREVNDNVVKEINAAISPSGVAPDRLSALKKLLADKDLLDKSIHNEATAVDRKKYPRIYESEVSSCDATPCSNGKLVYAVYGGGRDKGGCLIVCYDLEGNRQWNFHEALGAGEHSNHASPALIGDRLIHTVNKTILGFDAKTGQIKWRQTNPKWWLVESSGCPVRVGTTEAIAVDLAIVRASDGKLLWNGPENFWHLIWHVPIFENGIVYSLGCQTGYSLRECFTAVQLSEKVADQWEPRIQWKIKKADVVPSFTAPAYDADHIASPLYCDGLLYTVDMMGLMVVLDARTGERVYQRTLDMNQQCTRFDFGVAASPTLGGKHIFLLDNMGSALALEPGATYKEVGRNVLEDFDGPLWGGQERFFTSPVFDGKSILIRGRGYLYCIRAE